MGSTLYFFAINGVFIFEMTPIVAVIEFLTSMLFLVNTFVMSVFFVIVTCRRVISFAPGLFRMNARFRPSLTLSVFSSLTALKVGVRELNLLI